ncbi:MAG: polymer-forming cytoskeletal protein [Bdellovibrionota bacterium]
MSFGKAKESNETPTKVTPIPTVANSSLEAFLGKGSKVNGKISFDGPASIDGNVEGEIEAKNKLTIGEAANIKATVRGAEIIIRGTVQGDVIASTKLSLQKPARVSGNISGPAISIEEGVVFEGNCKMSDTAKTAA